jgi:DNA-binding NarL/FixJ family response regulator
MSDSDAHRQPSFTRVALVDPRRFLRDCVAVLLAKKAPEIDVVGLANATDASLDGVDLVVFWLDQPTVTALALFDEQVKLVRRRFPSTRLAAFVESKHTDPRILRHAVANGVALIDLDSATGDISVASIRLAIAGGNFAPVEFVCGPNVPFGGHHATGGNGSTPDGRAIEVDSIPSPNGITPREMQLLQCLDRGLQNKVIAHEMGISQSTVKIHLRNIMRKLNATNRTQVAILARGLKGRD